MLSVAPDSSVASEADSLLTLLEDALAARNQLGWSRWLQGEVQHFLPHDAIIVAWGDFKAGVVAYDVISSSPALSAHSMAKHFVEPLMIGLFKRWLASDQQPVVIESKDLRTGWPSLATLAPCALVHGVEDHRGHYDCIYLFLGPVELASPLSRHLCRMVLPFIDTGFRQLPDRDAAHSPGVTGAVEEAGERGSALSARELEIMEWVRMGKTNSEIAMILNLSTFTVKNHMRRIYKKLDVLNRAQAVGSLDRMHGTAEVRRPLMSTAASPSSRALGSLRNTA
jgi:transcriptional regulator EpsA